MLTIRRTTRQAAPIIGVGNPERLRAVAEAELRGHLGDPDLDAVVGTLRLACGVPIAVINIVRSNLQTYPAEVGVGAPCTEVPDGLSFCAEVVDTGRALVVADAARHPVYSRNPMVLGGVIGAYAGIPLIDSGVVLGSVSIFDGSAREFSAEVLEILGYQTRLAASLLALRRKARTDVLTGLPNRERLLDRLGSAIARLDRNPGLACVLYFDVDDFKGINDTYGHAVGDGVLVELGHRLLTVLRPTDTVSRFGGDEFVAACEDLKSVDDAELLIGRIVQAITADWHIGGQRLNVDVSIGCALTASSTTQPIILLHDADEAMYQAKQLPGTRSVVSVIRHAGAVAQPGPSVCGSHRGPAATMITGRGSPEQHQVLLYDLDDELVVAVAAFVTEGLRVGEGVVVVATPAHRSALKSLLLRQGIDVVKAAASGHYRALDATTTLSSFSPNGALDPRLFEAVIGGAVDAAGVGGRGVRAFGEMVALLWADGDAAAAIELERLWNDLAGTREFTLLCAYPTAALDAHLDLIAVDEVCRAHSQVRLPSGYGSSVPGAGPSRPGDDVSRVFVAAPSAVRAARSWVEAMLTGWGEDTFINDGTLVASELATNAVHHAGTAFRVSLRHSVGGVRIACEDLAAAGPEVVEVDSDATGGRGIGLVAELSARWGSDRTPSGKVVWAELTKTAQQEELDVAGRR